MWQDPATRGRRGLGCKTVAAGSGRSSNHASAAAAPSAKRSAQTPPSTPRRLQPQAFQEIRLSLLRAPACPPSHPSGHCLSGPAAPRWRWGWWHWGSLLPRWPSSQGWCLHAGWGGGVGGWGMRPDAAGQRAAGSRGGMACTAICKLRHRWASADRAAGDSGRRQGAPASQLAHQRSGWPQR
jgi:hypothetical protein